MKLSSVFAIGLTAAVGLSACVKNKGEITMTYSKASAVYGDLEVIRSTPLIAPARTIENPGKIFIGDQVILIGEEEKGIHVFDNSNPSNPVAISFLQLPMTREFYVSGDKLYAEGHYDFIKIDLIDIYNPKIIDRVEYAFGEGHKNDLGQEIIGFTFQTVTESIQLGSDKDKALKESTELYFDHKDQLIPVSSVPSSFSGLGEDVHGTLNKITTLNDYAYVVGAHKMYVFSDHGYQMESLNQVDIAGDVETVYPYDNHLYVGTQSSMTLLSVSNPELPYEVSTYFHPTSCDPVLPNGDIAYLTLRSADNSGCAGDENTLTVIDMTNKSNPTELHTEVMNSPYGMTLDGNYLWVGEGSNGLTLFDNTNPAAPMPIKTFTNVLAYDVIATPAQPNRIYVTGAGGMEIYSVDYQQLTLSASGRINY